MEWLARLFEKFPEMGVYLAVGVGYFLGRLKYRGFSLGVVTASLLAGIVLGSLFHVPVADQAKSMLFLLFLFGIGFSVGPSFFRNLKGEGWRWAVLAVFIPVVGLIAAYVMARLLRLDLGYSAGMLSGALTESPAIGTASEAIRGLQLSEEQKQLLVGHIAVADAICYIFGTIGVILSCSVIGPKLLGIDLRTQSKLEEEKLGIRPAKKGITSGWQPIGLRAYKVPQNAPIAGKTVLEAEQSVTDGRLFLERIRRQGKIFAPSIETAIQEDDIVAILGRTEVLVKVLGPKSAEVADPELLDIPVASCDLYVTSRDIAGKSIQEIVDSVAQTRSVMLQGITRGGQPMPIGANVIIHRGDTLHVMGPEYDVEKLAPLVGRKIQPNEESDVGVLGLAIFLGVLVGASIAVPIGGLRITLGTSVGTLLAGVAVGWARSTRPWFARIPDAAILFMRSIGLAAFVAMVGLKAGPIFIQAVMEAGYLLFLGGIVVTLVPLLSGILFGRYVLRLDPVLLLGGVAGAQTMIAGVAAVQEKSDSPIATLGYSYTVAIGHILLTTWGTIIVLLLA
ncbi:MAG: TrkA C-terminal domain-containing protein [Terracidiphilus sp.]